MARRVLHLVTAVAFIGVGAFVTWLGALGLLAHVPAAGTGGSLAVSLCTPVDRGGVTCTGTFTAPDGQTWTVVAEGVDRAGVTVDATIFPWDDARAYARGGVGSVLGAAGTTVFGGAVLAIGAVGAVMAVRGPRAAR